MQRGRNNTLIIVLGLVLVIAAGVLIFFVVSRGATPAATPTADPSASGGGVGAVGVGTPGASGTSVVITATSAPIAPPTATPTQFGVVVAARAIPAGTVLTADDLKIIPKPRAEVDESTDITDIGFAVNRINIVPYNPEQPIRKRELVEGGFSQYMKQLVQDRRLEPGKKAFAYVTNEVSAAAGLISENDLVDVVATYVFERRDTNPPPAGSVVQNNIILELTTKTILQNVRVLKVIRLEKGLQPITVPRPTPTAPPPPEGQPAQSTPVVVAGVGTPTPIPTLPSFQESGVGFTNNIILVLAVTDQEAEVLKYTREVRYALSASIQSNSQRVQVITNQNGQTQSAAVGTTSGEIGSTNPTDRFKDVPVIHFTLRGRPVDTTNPQDPALTLDRTSGVTYRTLVRDYGVPIPVIVFATQQ